MRVMHLKPTCELFQYLTSLFEMKKSNIMQREATRNPTTCVGTHQKCSEDSCKARDREKAAKKTKSTIQVGEQVKQPLTPETQTRQVLGPQSQRADCPNRRSSHTRGKGQKFNNRVDEGKRRASEQGATARGLGESAMDQGADGMSLATPASSPTYSPDKNATARGLGESATDQTADGVGLATPASSPNKRKSETSMDETTNETAACGGTQRHMDSTHTGHQHNASAYGNEHITWTKWLNSCTMSGSTQVPKGIIEDPGRCVEPSMSHRPPSTLLKGERGSYQPLSSCISTARMHAHVSSMLIEGEEGQKRKQVQSATKKNGKDLHTSRVNDDLPQAPPKPPPVLQHPKQSRDNAMNLNEPGTARTSTDTCNDPGSKTAAPGDHGSEWECSGSKMEGHNIEVNAPS
ncbi:hypothetical protein BS17DRAFT_766738 [Gyrodon lividus]|nr:hypothetical protein BS17DRAFT_766738 [Gyrodon lividus]